MARYATGRPALRWLALATIVLAGILLAPMPSYAAPAPDHHRAEHRAEASSGEAEHDCPHTAGSLCCAAHCLTALPASSPLPLELAFSPVFGRALRPAFEGERVPRIDRPPKA
jgi:hypothetical protein